MKRSFLVMLILFVLLFAVVLLAACNPEPTSELGNQTPESQAPETPGQQNDQPDDPQDDGDNEAEWQEGWNDH